MKILLIQRANVLAQLLGVRINMRVTDEYCIHQSFLIRGLGYHGAELRMHSMLFYKHRVRMQNAARVEPALCSMNDSASRPFNNITFKAKRAHR